MKKGLKFLRGLAEKQDLSDLDRNTIEYFFRAKNEVFEADRVTVKHFPYMGMCEVVHHKRLTQRPGYESTFTRFYDDLFTDVEYVEAFSDVERASLEGGSRSTEEEKAARCARRIRSRVKDLTLSNEWFYWVTLTVSPDKCDRYNLREVTYLFLRLVKARNERHKKWEPFKYVLIPEKHKDGAYHLHGFIKGVDGDELRPNKNGKVEIDFLADGLGFMTMTPLRLLPYGEKIKVMMYTLKYAEKAVASCKGEMNRGYLCSDGLVRPTVWSIAHDEIGNRFRELHDSAASYENEYVASRMYTERDICALLSVFDLGEVDKIRIGNNPKKLAEGGEKCGLLPLKKLT